MSDAFVSQLTLHRVTVGCNGYHESHLTFVRIWQDVPDNYVESQASESDVSHTVKETDKYVTLAYTKKGISQVVVFIKHPLFQVYETNTFNHLIVELGFDAFARPKIRHASSPASFSSHAQGPIESATQVH